MTARQAEEDRMLARIREADNGAAMQLTAEMLDAGYTREELIADVEELARIDPNIAVHRFVMALNALIRERANGTLTS